MGIKNLLYVKTDTGKIADLAEKIEWKHLQGKKLALDAMNIIYSSLSVNHEKFVLTDKNGRTTKHIAIILRKVLKFKKFNIDQLWVFDSKITTPLKKKEQEKRKETRKVNVEPAQIQEVQELLDLCGIHYITTTEHVESEVYASFLLRNNYVDYIISNDMDVLISGGNVITDKIKGMKKTAKYAGFLINYKTVLDKLQITPEQFLEIGLALGTDFNEKVPRIGPASVLKKVKNGITLTDDYLKSSNYMEAKEYFQQMMNNEFMFTLKPQFHSSTKDLEKLKQFLIERDFNVSKYPIQDL